MNQKKQDFSSHTSITPIEKRLSEREYCVCQPLSPLHKNVIGEKPEPGREEIVPTSSALNVRVCNTLQTLFPRSNPISIFLLHISQWEHTHIAQQPAPLQRQHYHVSSNLLEQIMTNVRRVMRADDQVLLQERAGAAIIFPDVDRQGAYIILERIYHSVCLLQSETLLPPLTLNTTILMGMGTYPQPASSLEQLLYVTGLPTQCFTLRPAITTHRWDTSSTPLQETEVKDEHVQNMKGETSFPFMKLPTTIPSRLRDLLPYSLATELHCVPVGRNHHCLTVAMADPSNREHIQRLREVANLTIFPVCCDLDELHTLLTKSW